MLLEDELTSSGFVVGKSPAGADLTLIGVFTLRIVRGEEDAKATIRGVSHEGSWVWGGDFAPRFS